MRSNRVKHNRLAGRRGQSRRWEPRPSAFDRALAACRAALACQQDREARRFQGRWALPSGRVITVLRVEPGRAFCGDRTARWWVETLTLAALADAGALRFLGRN